MGIYDSMLVKYGALFVGYAILGLPVFVQEAKSTSLQSEMMRARSQRTTWEILPFSLIWPRLLVEL